MSVLRLFVRFLSLLFFAVALGVLGLLIAAAWPHPLGKLWADVHLISLQLFQVGVERHLGLDWLWKGVFQPLLEMRAAWVLLIFAVPGLILWFLGRRPRQG